jgi:uncharacterized protein DUF5522
LRVDFGRRAGPEGQARRSFFSHKKAQKHKMNSCAEKSEKPEPLKEGEDYYFEDGLMVLTARYLLRRGYCCEQGCRNCPYGFVKSDE